MTALKRCERHPRSERKRYGENKHTHCVECHRESARECWRRNSVQYLEARRRRKRVRP